MVDIALLRAEVRSLAMAVSELKDQVHAIAKTQTCGVLESVNKAAALPAARLDAIERRLDSLQVAG